VCVKGIHRLGLINSLPRTVVLLLNALYCWAQSPILFMWDLQHLQLGTTYVVLLLVEMIGPVCSHRVYDSLSIRQNILRRHFRGTSIATINLIKKIVLVSSSSS
jgi:hypothetical protein